MSPKRVSYRDLRNEPGRVFERLADGVPLELVSDGVPKALIIPIHDGDTAAALDAWKRGEALAGLASLQADARAAGSSTMDLAEITAEIAAARAARRAQEEER